MLNQQPSSAVIEKFLSTGRWSIDSERRITRKACADLLARLPEDVAAEIVVHQKIIVFAPNEGRIAAVLPYRITAFVAKRGATAGSTRMQVIYLAPALEKYDYARVVAVLAENVAHAWLQIAAGRRSGDRIGLAKSWGFDKELQVLYPASQNPN
jgi:hypothetical protein